MNDHCEYCENEIDRIIYTDSQRFCSEQCRIDYHNTQRKVLRKAEAIQRATKDLYTMLADDGMIGMHGFISGIIEAQAFQIIDKDKYGAIERKCPECELINVRNQIYCDCGAKTKFHRFIPISSKYYS